jgi:dihydroorotase
MTNTMIIKHAEVIDPSAGKTQKRDLCILDGRFAEMPDREEDIPVFDAAGCYAAPGFVDSHVHVFENHAAISIPADQIGIRQGVHTVVDAGSTGVKDYDFFEKEIISRNSTDVRFFLNIARSGLCGGLSELADMDDLMTPEELSRFQKQHGSHIVGLKVRMSGSVVKENGILPLVYARELSDKSGLPLMIHIGNQPPKLNEVLDLLRQGDIVTHCFHGKAGGVPDYPGEFVSAASRGVRFDVGHGSASFSSDTVPRVMGIYPVDFTISTDLYSRNFESPVGSLMDTMTKFLPYGFTVEDLVRRVTDLPRKFLGLSPAAVRVGEPADLTIFRINQGARELVDSEGKAISVTRYFEPVAAIMKGKKVWSNEF